MRKPREIPILMSTPMVKATAAGRKTITRRTINLREFQPSSTPGYDWTFRCKRGLWQDYRNADLLAKVCRWHPGDRLWVRETWSPDHAAFYPNWPVVYKADENGLDIQGGKVYSSEQKNWYRFKWRPSIHMPRWASRITLEVLSVRAERLHDITEDEAAAEGLPAIENPDYDPEDPCDDVEFSHVAAFAALWDEINGKGAWDANPFCWRIEFRRVDHA